MVNEFRQMYYKFFNRFHISSSELNQLVVFFCEVDDVLCKPGIIEKHN